ncbi:MAG TPA: putative quinol monooxygenase [Albidovulum sp.]|uniref:putative quinol monooxygenase n=1 Tax=Albidovulum sp. TaxID=1872424 RepID=UPI002C0BE9BF|nr:putative quinol monooxygenase [Albidovulum sp.]
MSDELFIVVGLSARPGKEDVLREDLARLVAPSRGEAGNLRYDLFEDINAPGRFVFVEHWESPEAQRQHHETGPHIEHFHAHGDANVESRDFIHMLRRVVP